jgi:MFS family permease
MSKTRMVLLTIAGSVVGLLVGGVLLYVGACAVIAGTANGNEDYALMAVIIFGPVGFLVGAIVGAAAGATVVQKVLRQRTSFWKALLGTVAGLLVGVLPPSLPEQSLALVGRPSQPTPQRLKAEHKVNESRR